MTQAFTAHGYRRAVVAFDVLPRPGERCTIAIPAFVENRRLRGGRGRHGDLPSRLTEDPRMPRKYIDCRLFPSDSRCTVAISADTVDEVVDAAVEHAVAVHKHQDSPQLRQQIRASVKDGSPNS